MDQKIAQQISQMIGTNVQGAYQTRFSLIASAATLAVLPNWRQVLEEEFDGYLEEIKQAEPNFKEDISKQVAADAVLEARGVVGDAIERALASSTKHYSSLIKMIERLTQEKN